MLGFLLWVFVHLFVCSFLSFSSPKELGPSGVLKVSCLQELQQPGHRGGPGDSFSATTAGPAGQGAETRVRPSTPPQSWGYRGHPAKQQELRLTRFSSCRTCSELATQPPLPEIGFLRLEKGDCSESCKTAESC